MLGMASWSVPDLIPGSVMTYVHFVGAAAAPASLFALGVVLASHPVTPVEPTTWAVVLSKVALHPLLFLVAAGMMQTPIEQSNIALLVAAGPCGAMPFVIALQYGVPTNAITKAIILSTVITLFTLAALTA